VQANGAPFLLVAAAVGDSTIFRFDAAKDVVQELTTGVRPEPGDSTDCGGRLGPQLPGGKPDLRNLCVVASEVHAGDLLMVMTDGVADNLDPEYLCRKPFDVGLSAEVWSVVPRESALRARVNFQRDFMLRVVHEHNANPAAVLSALIDHCIATTQPGRDFLAANPNQQLPAHDPRFPGRPDHCTCVVIACRPPFNK
jgi:hypothetical protein